MILLAAQLCKFFDNASRKKKGKKMSKSIVVLKEYARGEKRVILSPDEVSLFVAHGYDVFVENGAGMGIGIPDGSYENVGAVIVGTEEAWQVSNVVLKYKPPTSEQYQYLHPDMTIGAIFHAEGNYALIKALLNSGVTAYTYEFFQTNDGIYPMTVIGGEIAGKMAVIYAAYHLQVQYGGSGVLLSNVLGENPAKCVVIGYGNVGSSVAIQLANLGCDVLVLGTNQEKLRRFQSVVGNRIKTAIYTPQLLEAVLPEADAVFGAILISTYTTPPIVTEAMVKSMKPGSILVDVTSGYGPGYMETFTQESSLVEPVFTRFGVLHCKIDNLPSAVPTSTARAYSRVAAPYLLNMVNAIYSGNTEPISQRGMIVSRGKITHPVIQEHFEYYKGKEET